jgi:peptide/nickel transport system permease protein
MTAWSESRAADPVATTTPAKRKRSAWRTSGRILMVVAGGLVLLAVVHPEALIPHDPFAISGALRLKPPAWPYVFGTDHLGRDVLSRIIIGTQPSLLISGGVVVLAVAGGLVGGMLAGFYRRLDNIIMRIMDGMMAFPAIMLALAIVAIMGRSIVNMIIAIAIVYTPQIARVCRSAVLACREQDYVTGAFAAGASDFWIMTRHLLPNVMPVLAVQATYFFARALLTEASLSFLGLGLPPDVPTWGMVLGEGRRFLRDAPWTTIFPGMAIALSVVALNVLGDHIRDRLDPRLKTIDR